MNSYILLNGNFSREDEPVISANSRALRYGDGLFETMKFVHGRIPLQDYHFQRLFAGMRELAFEQPPGFTAHFLLQQVTSLLNKNHHLMKARIRLMIFRGTGGLFDNHYGVPNYLIESSPLPAEEMLNEKGLIIDIFPRANKSCDLYSAIKSNNFLPYAMAAIYAQQQHLNDCLLLNASKRICDATIANIFFIKNEVIYTPALSEGCIAGVMRRYLLETLPKYGYIVNETSVTPDQLSEADEVFLTNAVSGIRWVKQCGNIEYDFQQTARIYNLLVKPLFL